LDPVNEMTYDDFDLQIQRRETGYCARVLNSGGGEATIRFELPFSDVELENFYLKVGRPRHGVRGIDTPELALAKSFGRGLFNAVFQGNLKTCFQISQNDARQRGRGLRVKLRLIDVPELADVPWEFLYNSDVNQFLSLSDQTPIVRYLDIPTPTIPFTVDPPLRILTVISSPNDCEKLDVEREWNQLSHAVDTEFARTCLQFERLKGAHYSDLARRLMIERYHVLHFIGHGGFDRRAGEGVLIFEDEKGNASPITGERLRVLLGDHPSLRLVVLNSCEGARSPLTDAFGGIAQSLVQRGIAAVVAMQFEITDKAAITFARDFYDAIAHGRPIDSAVAQARKSIFYQENDIEWGTPVLYLHAPDGRIFDVTKFKAYELKKRREGEERAKRAAAEREKLEAEARSKREAEAHAMREAEGRKKFEAEAREAEARAKREDGSGASSDAHNGPPRPASVTVPQKNKGGKKSQESRSDVVGTERKGRFSGIAKIGIGLAVLGLIVGLWGRFFGADRTVLDGKPPPPVVVDEKLPPHVFANETGDWRPEDGYSWVTGSKTVTWVAGTPSLEYRHLVTGKDVGKWLPDDGYSWIHPLVAGDMTVKWVPGMTSQKHDHIVADDEEGKFRPADGYRWVNDPPPGDWSVRWSPGEISRLHPHVVASSSEGHWNAEQGYEWVNPSNNEDLSVRPSTQAPQ